MPCFLTAPGNEALFGITRRMVYGPEPGHVIFVPCPSLMRGSVPLAYRASILALAIPRSGVVDLVVRPHS
jgi:hypothetical protein